MLLVLYSHPMKRVVTFLLLWILPFYLHIPRSTLHKGLAGRSHLRRHIDYSGLEGTKGGASTIRRYFADDQLIWLNKRNIFSVSLLKTVDSSEFMCQNH